MTRLLAALRDPANRSRLIIWMGVLLIVIVLLWAFALVGTSYRWFCEEPCHIVHADNTAAYNASTHSKISCIACHEPLNASPLTYTFMKIYVMPDLYSTVTKTFHLPMNAEHEVALKMPSKQCTQCHNLKTRTITPDRGIIINHDAHSSRNISCTTCHNRVAHDDDAVQFTLPGDKKHANWMSMDACFRCHGQEPGAKAPGECAKCHTASFKLVPASHEATGWYTLYGDSKGHAKAAKAESASVAAAPVHAETAESHTKRPTSEAEPTLKAAEAVNSCYTCHKSTFCLDCHGGLQMPHPAEFKKTHGAQGYAQSAVCAKCHARSAAEAQGTGFCNACHHPAGTPGTPWISQHPDVVKAAGDATACFKCHDERQCSYCHVNGTPAGEALLKQSFSQGK